MALELRHDFNTAATLVRHVGFLNAKMRQKFRNYMKLKISNSKWKTKIVIW